MKAAIWYGGKDIGIEERPKPTIRDSEVLGKVKAVGICGSELHAYEGISKRRTPPLIMGHEFAGEIVEVGEEAKGLQEGDRVAVDPLTRCGVCGPCMRGRGNVCRNVRLIGLHTSGAFAEYVAVLARNCHKLPDNVSFEEGSAVEPMAVAVHAVNRTPIKLGDTVVVLGAGIIGLTLLQAAKLAGAGKVFITDLLNYRLNLAKRLGADVTINSKAEDPVGRIMELTAMNGADVSLEAVGSQVTVQQAMAAVGIGGRVTVVGMLAKTMELDVLDAVVKEMDIKGSYAYTPGDFRAALDMISAGRADVKSLITNVLPLSDVAKGFQLLHDKTEGVVKVVLRP